MSTCNFETMDDFPLIVGGLYEDYSERFKEAFPGEPEDPDRIYDEISYDAEQLQEDVIEFSEALTYYEVTLKSGYYDGWQFYVTEKYGLNFDTNSTWCIDNDEAHYYFDECRSAVLRKATTERRKIIKWLRSTGYKEIECVGVFSNGEAVYEYVS